MASDTIYVPWLCMRRSGYYANVQVPAWAFALVVVVVALAAVVAALLVLRSRRSSNT